jgi:hypothetical protein
MTYIVTLTLNDAHGVSRVIDEALAQGAWGITIDEAEEDFSTETLTLVTNERPYDPNEKGSWSPEPFPPKPDHMSKADARAKIKRSQLKAEKFRQERDAQHMLDEERSWKKAMKVGMMLDAIGALDCPTCWATKSTECIDLDGNRKNGYAHPARIQAMVKGISADEMAHHMSMKFNEREEVRRINDMVSCAKCGAHVGDRCITSGGHALGHYVHTARREDYLRGQGVL